MVTMGERIVKLREQKGWRQSDLAKLARMPLSTLNMIERGVRQGDGLSVGTAKRLAKALGVALDYLVGMYEDEDLARPPAIAPSPAGEELQPVPELPAPLPAATAQPTPRKQASQTAKTTRKRRTVRRARQE